MKLRPYSLIVVGCVLIVGLGLILYGSLRPMLEPSFKARLTHALPSGAELPGWVRIKEEIAATPEMKRAVDELLNFDDAAFFRIPKAKTGYRFMLRIGSQARCPSDLSRDTRRMSAGWAMAGRSVAGRAGCP
jgi:ribosomal protein L39E